MPAANRAKLVRRNSGVPWRMYSSPALVAAWTCMAILGGAPGQDASAKDRTINRSDRPASLHAQQPALAGFHRNRVARLERRRRLEARYLRRDQLHLGRIQAQRLPVDR